MGSSCVLQPEQVGETLQVSPAGLSSASALLVISAPTDSRTPAWMLEQMSSRTAEAPTPTNGDSLYVPYQHSKHSMPKSREHVRK
eukprot:6467050-Amphidinium_carterae.1